MNLPLNERTYTEISGYSGCDITFYSDGKPVAPIHIIEWENSYGGVRGTFRFAGHINISDIEPHIFDRMDIHISHEDWGFGPKKYWIRDIRLVFSRHHEKISFESHGTVEEQWD